VLTALPGCGQLLGLDQFSPPDATTPDPGFNLIRGSFPRDGVMFCNVVQARRCATTLDKEIGIRLTEAAIALNTRRSSQIALDYSPEARTELGCGDEPVALQFQGMFPEGIPVCLNCGEVLGPGKANPDAAAVCQAFCYDLFLNAPDATGASLPVKPPAQSTVDFCAMAASVSTNMPLDACIANACDSGGTLTAFFNDPRRTPEPVVWADPIKTIAGGQAANDLIRNQPNVLELWDAGAVSQQWIRRGDAFVEFSVMGNTAQMLGVSSIPSNCPEPCPDIEPGQNSIGFGIVVAANGDYFVLEGGEIRSGPNTGGSWGPSMAGDRFRVYVRDNGNGTAQVRYSRVPPGGCTPGAPCNDTVFYPSGGVITYPLRVDASLFENGAALIDVRLMRIK
jgi:hypothetical protein